MAKSTDKQRPASPPAQEAIDVLNVFLAYLANPQAFDTVELNRRISRAISGLCKAEAAHPAGDRQPDIRKAFKVQLGRNRGVPWSEITEADVDANIASLLGAAQPSAAAGQGAQPQEVAGKYKVVPHDKMPNEWTSAREAHRFHIFRNGVQVAEGFTLEAEREIRAALSQQGAQGAQSTLKWIPGRPEAAKDESECRWVLCLLEGGTVVPTFVTGIRFGKQVTHYMELPEPQAGRPIVPPKEG